jgi:two-component system, NtrC family, sensor kinase
MDMKKTLYSNFRRNIIFYTLLVSFAPLAILGGSIYYNFAKVYGEKIEDQIKYRAKSQANAVEVFLKERVAILSTLVDTQSFESLKQQKNLSHIFEVIGRRTEGLVDLGVINANGDHVAYSGPYELAGYNYFHTVWFNEVMSKGTYISDVFMGYRKSPHFVIAVRGHADDGQNWILRATIDPDIFQQMIRPAQIGRSGDAYIINKEGTFQTQPRFDGDLLKQSPLEPNLFGQGTSVAEKLKIDGKAGYYAGAWLKSNDWLLVISQEVNEEMAGLLTTRNFAVLIIVLGCIGIFYTTVKTTNMMVKRLEKANDGINELNARLMQSDKLAALGKMAAGIAHEINNPLAVIGEKAGWMRDLLLEEEFKNSENYREYLASIDKIEQHVERARKITHNMLGFVRKMEPRLDDVDVNNVLNQTVELLQNQARLNNIAIQKDMDPILPIIAADQSGLQQVFLNLISNAIDAIEGEHKKEGLILIRTSRENSHILVRIEDDGPGIAPEYERRIFDPFFTTKKTGKGTGLGLSISFNIIEKMGGMLLYENRVPSGAAFTVKIPVVIPEKK